MIIKSYELKKLNLENYKFILFYGKNDGYINYELGNILKKNKDKEIINYEEKEVLNNLENLYNNILSNSFFNNKKIIVIKRASERIVSILSSLIEKEIQDVNIFILSEVLEKKSKLRSMFEKGKKFACIPFYEDDHSALSKIAQDFFREKKITISQENINLIVRRCRGNRGYLKNELNKIELYSRDKKKILTEDIYKLTNLSEDYAVSELVDSCLAKNKKKVLNILNENNYSSDHCMEIIRTFLIKAKTIMKLSENFNKNKNINQTINEAKPPIFWKNKDIVKQQILNWDTNKIKEFIFDLNKIELFIKKNTYNSEKIVMNFILEKTN